MRFTDKYAQRDKGLLRLERELNRLHQAQGQAPIVPLEHPYQRGWVKSFVLRQDALHHPEVAVFSAVLAVVNQRVLSRNREFVSSRGHAIVLRHRIIPVWDNLFLSGLRSRAQDFLGTQGDGNHFAYVGRNQFTEPQRAAIEAAGYTELSDTIVRRDGKINVLVTHHGSRGLGADVYKRGQAAARSCLTAAARSARPSWARCAA